MSSSPVTKKRGVSREYYVSELSQNVERLNTSLSKLAELHGSLLLNNMNIVKYIKQLQCHLADVKHEYKKSSEQ